jgi:hypothetical protein
MAFEDSDRRRTYLLAMLTLIAVPVIYFVSQADGDDPVESTDPAVSAEAAEAPNSSSNRPPLEPPADEPIFLDGPPSDLSPGVAEIAVPKRPDPPPLELTGSYRSSVAGVRTCLVREVRSGLSVTITNLDNGRSITCVTAFGPEGQVADVVMHTTTFSLLADLTDAPIPVELAQ